ncbi:MAG: A/G-specific adenine glycosylase [Fibrobacteria bacterium]
MMARLPAKPGTGEVAEWARALTSWFQANRRELPWRTPWVEDGAVREPEMEYGRSGDGDPGKGESVKGRSGKQERGADPIRLRDPYATWISEIMLQQTQVSTVMDYFRRWMARFPDIRTLASAAEADVLEAWAGLGYYSRARNLLATARKIVDGHAGRFPWRREELLALKGVGEYTAGAIASLAFNRPEPILDGNIVRVFSRLYALPFLPDSSEGRSRYWALSRAWAGSGRPALVNEGLMELGALVCAPKSPDCPRCPLAPFCRAHADTSQDRFPPAKLRKGAVVVSGFGVAVVAGAGAQRRVLLYTPRKPERLAGLLTFPFFEAGDLPGLRAAWKSRLPGLAEASLRPLAVTVTHSITHHRYRIHLAEARMDPACLKAPLPEGFTWCKAGELERILVSSLSRKIWKALVSPD